MKKSIIKFWDKIIILLLGSSGIVYSCMEYGAPEASYAIKGVVTNKETSRPIKHIQITAQTNDYEADTLYTNNHGIYELKFSGFPLDKPFHLKFEDIDGKENGGEFETQEIDVKFTESDRVQKGKGAWDKGKFAKTENIVLEQKNENYPMYGVRSTTFKP